MMRLGIDWDEEDAAEEAARQQKASKTRNTATVAAEPAVANAVAPPTAAAHAAATPAAPPVSPASSAKPSQSFAESIIRRTEPYWNPIHLKPGVQEFKSYEDIDPYATAAHGLAEFFAYQHGVKPILGGLSQGVANRISNTVSGVDPTIKAQVAATNAKIQSNEKIAAMKYGQPQGPDRTAVPTPEGRIEPTFDTTPLPDGPSPASPEAIATNSAKPNPLDLYAQQKHGYPLATLEEFSQGPLKNQTDIDIVANSYKRGGSISVNPMPGTVSNQTAVVPTIKPNVPINPTGAFAQTPNYSPTPPAPQGGFDPSLIGQPLQDPLAGRGYQTPPQEIGPRPNLVAAAQSGEDMSQVIKEDVAHMVQEADKPVAPPAELRTGTGKPAYAGQGPAAEIRTKGKKAGEPMLRNNYARIEDVPAGYAFVPGAQHIDTSRTNIGQAEYTKAYTNRPFPVSNEMAVQESNDINRMLGRPTRAEAKAAGIALPPQTPGITKHVLEGKGSPFMGTKAAKVGGVLGALIAIPDLVNAQTVGQRGMAGANLLESVLPLGAQINEAGAPGVQQSQVSQAALLGSPYAQTEWAKNQRLRERAGAGRGIAPPSAYQR